MLGVDRGNPRVGLDDVGEDERPRLLANPAEQVPLLPAVEVMVASHARMHARVERRGGVWRIVRLGAVYFEDEMRARVPGEVPALDATRLAGYRPSLRFLSYLLEEGGKTPRADLAGIDRPDLVEAFLAADRSWLG